MKVDDMPVEETEKDLPKDGADEGSASATVKRPRRGVYLLPNLFTTAALFSGFYAIIAAMNGNFTQASVAIFISMVLDGLDGRIARLTRTQSAFGAEYDSLADMVSFGIAPALIVFTWALAPLGKVGWIAAFIYAVGAALRLARFNTMIGSQDKRYFTGLPSPSAAAIVAGVIWACESAGVTGDQVASIMALLVPVTGLLMVSNVKYHSFKELDMKRRVPFTAILIMVLVFAVIALEPTIILLAVFAIYTLSGPVNALLRKARGE